MLTLQNLDGLQNPVQQSLDVFLTRVRDREQREIFFAAVFTITGSSFSPLDPKRFGIDSV